MAGTTGSSPGKRGGSKIKNTTKAKQRTLAEYGGEYNASHAAMGLPY